MYARIVVVTLLIGALIGGTAVFFGPRFLKPHLPAAMQDHGTGISGPVVAKRVEGDRLLITVSTAEGAILVTFRKKLSEIELLVEEGDTVTLDVKSYQPFMQDPELRAVRKKDMTPAAAPTPKRTQVQPQTSRPTPSLTTPADTTTMSGRRP